MNSQREYQLDCLATWMLDHFVTQDQRRASFLRMWLRHAGELREPDTELNKLVRAIKRGEYSDGLAGFIEARKDKFENATVADIFIEDLKARVMRIFNERSVT